MDEARIFKIAKSTNWDVLDRVLELYEMTLPCKICRAPYKHKVFTETDPQGFQHLARLCEGCYNLIFYE